MALNGSDKEEILDAVAEQIADLIENTKNLNLDAARSDKYFDSLVDVKQRISVLETKVEKKMQDLEIIVNSFQNQSNDRLNSVTGEKQKEHAQMADQITKLRTGLIKLSNEIKEIKIQLALKKM
jgi:uncharacterized coiled-coil protein SlyX